MEHQRRTPRIINAMVNPDIAESERKLARRRQLAGPIGMILYCPRCERRLGARVTKIVGDSIYHLLCAEELLAEAGAKRAKRRGVFDEVSIPDEPIPLLEVEGPSDAELAALEAEIARYETTTRHDGMALVDGRPIHEHHLADGIVDVNCRRCSPND